MHYTHPIGQENKDLCRSRILLVEAGPKDISTYKSGMTTTLRLVYFSDDASSWKDWQYT
jgi:hypothetical protein